MDVDPELSSLRGRRILIVEDELLVAMELEGLLQQRGCTTLGPVPDQASAMTCLEQERPDVVLVDLNLKGESAAPLAAALSDLGIPFVLVSGYSRTQAGAMFLQSVPHVSKPVNEPELMRALVEALRST